MRFRKVYVEISNICNMHCRFCPGTKREKRIMQQSEFSLILDKLRPYTDYLYFHLMGEPLLHPHLEEYLRLADAAGFKVILTTNGTLLGKQQAVLLSAPALHKVNISLHAFEANDLPISFSAYLSDCMTFGQAAQGQLLTVFRLWNQGGENLLNDQILSQLKTHFPGEWVKERLGTRIGERVYLEYGDRFDWPDLSAPEEERPMFCYGLRDQLGVLCDGTVVPCCLDHEGDLALGNLFSQSMEQILQTPRANAIYDGFSKKVAAEPLCRRCGYARRFG